MKILLSAYACEPGIGSEPAVGWNWAQELSQLGHEVWVLTRQNNRPHIEKWLKNRPPQHNLHFIYYDVPKRLSFWKKGGRGVHLYYLLWQIGAYRTARKAHCVLKFDLVHHVTFVGARQPSFLGLLGVPFVFGPVAGGERAPFRLRKYYCFKSKVAEFMRDIWNLFTPFDPLMRHTYKRANKIFVTSDETRALVPSCHHHKIVNQLAIGIYGSGEWSPRTKKPGPLRLLYVGRFVDLKGVAIALRAIASARAKGCNCTLTLVGEGPAKTRWQKLSKNLGLDSYVFWQCWMPQEELEKTYENHDVLFFPSLRDSGGMVILEAMQAGMPIVCLALGGAKVMVDGSCGRAIAVENISISEVEEDIADAIVELAKDDELYTCLSAGALDRANLFSWQNLVQSVSFFISSALTRGKDQS